MAYEKASLLRRGTPVKRLARITLALLLLSVFFDTSPAAARDWTLKDTDGNDYALSQHLSGSPVLMMFWATWCKPCKKELDDFKTTIDYYADSLDVEVLLISIDTQKSMSRVKPYIESKGYKWTTLTDPDWEVLKMYGGSNKIPYTVLLDGKGSTAWKQLGEMQSTDALTTEIMKLIGKPGE
jgi:cytochrome c biogenesis protein CcmG, thiol:disulfide interchange protein DsbE